MTALLEERPKINPQVEKRLENSKQRWKWLGHLFMFVMLGVIVAVYLKNNFFFHSHSFTYMEAFSYPVCGLILLAVLILYFGFVVKVRDSHPRTHGWLTWLLFITAACLTLVALGLGLFFDEPSSYRPMVGLMLVPYYIAYVIIVGFFIFISPGLLNKLNGIPKYKFVLAIFYLAFLGFYPVFYIAVVSQPHDSDSEDRQDKPHQQQYND
mmetsp:Transcript_22993/g.35524  ORF Transcript_22993/g.35524 Transcript_22993/m.35524 type:complete len:210 (+) Transcript_22993:376-1005(+)|eukprot:CAMPEP_0170499580 /NCGR_PEP_ID=MMETSP0208-20121228/31843_1 /TAXON_ID=197538 /ORGANISM="Strombidium inclinatum, Strain S3" /LENGTH=209 /DNA_ID=CAMNT_0010777193 /DNA_START=322 /DNA_END=951 /DNA_ORIENTATION=+